MQQLDLDLYSPPFNHGIIDASSKWRKTAHKPSFKAIVGGNAYKL